VVLPIGVSLRGFVRVPQERDFFGGLLVQGFRVPDKRDLLLPEGRGFLFVAEAEMVMLCAASVARQVPDSHLLVSR
jgi:hypothetical protein